MTPAIPAIRAILWKRTRTIQVIATIRIGGIENCSITSDRSDQNVRRRLQVTLAQAINGDFAVIRATLAIMWHTSFGNHSDGKSAIGTI